MLMLKAFLKRKRMPTGVHLEKRYYDMHIYKLGKRKIKECVTE